MMAKNLKEQDSEVFFVEVMDPAEIRRNILESLKQILELLQKFEKFKHLRHEKLQKIQKLRSLMKDTNKMLGNLKLKLPQTSLKYMPANKEKKTSAKPSRKKKEAKEEKIPKKEKTELERLEAELSAIESKLKSFT